MLDRSDIIWIDAIPAKVHQMKFSGIPNIYQAIVSNQYNSLLNGLKSPNVQSMNSVQYGAYLKQQFFQFFHPFHKLFSLLEKTKYELHILLLPEKLQMILSSHPTAPLLLTDSNLKLLLLLFHLPMNEYYKVCTIRNIFVFELNYRFLDSAATKSNSFVVSSRN
jgi:hypothetical protein